MAWALPLLLSACAFKDSHLAAEAQSRLIGLSEAELQSCIGAPDQHSTFGNTDVLTYYASSSSNFTYSIPLVSGIGLANSGYCHATFTVVNGKVMRVLYSGEKNATLAPDAYCAPIIRTCLSHVDEIRADGAALGDAQAPEL